LTLFARGNRQNFENSFFLHELPDLPIPNTKCCVRAKNMPSAIAGAAAGTRP
jgi:hypothetical protein